MHLLQNPIRDYAWGSRETIAALQGRPVPSAGPEAELWMGAHPDDPSLVVGDRGPASLADVIAADPVGQLGAGTVAEFGVRFPFLFKLLAAAQPLSLQAHPDAEQARTGFDAQRDLPDGDPRRIWRDPYHKPELLVALEPFEALCGFRDPADSRAVLADLGLAELEPVLAALALPDPERALRTAVETLLGWPEPERAVLVARAAAAAAVRPGGGPSGGGAGRFATERAILTGLAARYPGDMGVLVAMLLNPLRLAPGEGIWMPAGNLHSYLGGTGMEIMAASDNVLRGGLTPKPVNVPELLRLLRYEVLADPVVRPVDLGPGLVTWPTPAREFALLRAEPAGVPAALKLPGQGARIVFCARGRARFGSGSGTDSGVAAIDAGQAVFVPAEEPPVLVNGDATVFQASVRLGWLGNFPPAA